MDIATWLRNLGLDRYEPAFRDNEIDAEVLPRLKAEDLTAIGVTAVGRRRKLLDAIAALRKAHLRHRGLERPGLSAAYSAQGRA